MTDFMSQPRFQIPSVRELKQARLLKKLTNKTQDETDSKFERTVEFYRCLLKEKESRTRQKQRDDNNPELNQRCAEAYAFYLSIINNPNSTVREKLLARERIDKLFGLDKG